MCIEITFVGTEQLAAFFRIKFVENDRCRRWQMGIPRTSFFIIVLCIL